MFFGGVIFELIEASQKRLKGQKLGIWANRPKNSPNLISQIFIGISHRVTSRCKEVKVKVTKMHKKDQPYERLICKTKS